MTETNGKNLILTSNVGSSSIKMVVFETQPSLRPLMHATIEEIGLDSCSLIVKKEGSDEQKESVKTADHTSAVKLLLECIQDVYDLNELIAVGNRVVFGGPKLRRTKLLNNATLAELERNSKFDSDHMPYILDFIYEFGSQFSHIQQVLCFDSAFFADLPKVASMLPIPRKYHQAGLKKYGYHGLSYTSLRDNLREMNDDKAEGRVIMAHLGSGASVTGMVNGKPVDTTMSFTPTSGIPMSSRSGDIDPSVASYLIGNEGMSVQDYDDMINRKSGLIGISETTSDMHTLIGKESSDERARDAVNLFCYSVKKAIGSLSAVMGGVDMIVFSGGIGERSAPVRDRICDGLEYLGIALDQEKNQQGFPVISKDDTIRIRVMHTDEESVIAKETLKII